MTRLPGFVAAVFAVIGLSFAQGSAPAQSSALQAEVKAAEALRDQGKYAEAADAFRAIIARAPGTAVAHFNLAYCVHSGGDHAAAIELHEIAAQFVQVRPHALYNLACALAQSGRPGDALDALDRSVSAGMPDADLARNDPDLASIRADPRFEEILGYVGQPVDRAMDFWVGDWDCYSVPSKQLSGHNVIESRLGGRAILEQWSPASGTPGVTGESWNVYDAAEGCWKQTWVANSGNVIEFRGRRMANGLLLEASGHDGQGGTQLRRIFLRPVEGGDGGDGGEGGRVQQTGTKSTDGGATWAPEYDLLYVPKGEQP